MKRGAGRRSEVGLETTLPTCGYRRTKLVSNVGWACSWSIGSGSLPARRSVTSSDGQRGSRRCQHGRDGGPQAPSPGRRRHPIASPRRLPQAPWPEPFLRGRVPVLDVASRAETSRGSRRCARTKELVSRLSGPFLATFQDAKKQCSIPLCSTSFSGFVGCPSTETPKVD